MLMQRMKKHLLVYKKEQCYPFECSPYSSVLAIPRNPIEGRKNVLIFNLNERTKDEQIFFKVINKIKIETRKELFISYMKSHMLIPVDVLEKSFEKVFIDFGLNPL